MKALSATIACLAASLLVGALAVAEEIRKVKLVFATDGTSEPIVFEGDELTLGETRSISAPDGRPVNITRTEAGYAVEVDGKHIDLAMPEVKGGGNGFRWVSKDVEDGDGEAHQVIIHELVGDGDAEVEIVADGQHKMEKRVHVIHAGPGKAGEHGDAAAAGDGKRMVKVFVHGDGDQDLERAELKARLIASGTLDKLDEETRRKVLAALESDN